VVQTVRVNSVPAHVVDLPDRLSEGRTATQFAHRNYRTAEDSYWNGTRRDRIQRRTRNGAR